MANHNREQIEEWNGELGQQWTALRAELSTMVAPFNEALMAAAAAAAGERVLDVGCGCGETSVELARHVGPGGQVIGVDVSRPMLAVALETIERERLHNVSFLEADASACDLPSDIDLLFSRFGMMFFGDPATAFHRLRRSLRPAGRLVSMVWRHPRDNPWAMTPLVAARKGLGIKVAPVDPHAPGPFSLADEDRVRDLLAGAGFQTIRIERFDAPILLGANARAAADAALRFGPTSRLAREAGAEHMPAIREAVRAALAAVAAPEGHILLGGSTWIVSAENHAL